MLIGIAGGIGSGKSCVSRILRLRGFEVIDCDWLAKRLMAADASIKRRIREEISEEVTDGLSVPDRVKLARVVFADEGKRMVLNDIVHGAVRDQIRRMSETEDNLAGDFAEGTTECVERPVFVEAALLAESGLAGMCGKIVRVESDYETRIKRINSRDGHGRDEAVSRIESQKREAAMLDEFLRENPGIEEIRIENGEDESLLGQVDEMIERI